MIQVKTFFAYNDLRNFTYLIYDDKTGEAWVIDPFEAGPVIEYIKKLDLLPRGILNTHQHFDHIRGNIPLLEAFDVEIKKLKNSTRINLNQENDLEILDSPGHTMDHQVFLLKHQNVATGLFAGDTFFNAGVGNCHNGGNVDVLYETTQNLLSKLPPTTKLYPGHDYLKRNLEFSLSIEPHNGKVPELLRAVKDSHVEDRPQFTLGQEREINPFFRLQSQEIREKFHIPENDLDDKTIGDRTLFKKIRSLRDKW